MKTFKIIISVIIIFLLPIIAEAKSDKKKDDNIIDAVTVKNGITVTEIEESGKEIFEFTGTHAESVKKNLLKVYNVRATINQPDGSEIIIMTEVAYYNKNKRELTTDKYVEIISADGVMTGIGMYLNTEKKIFRLLKDVQIDSLRKTGDLGLNIPE
ncbi:MAG: LPS export ABC transporter periplasmic protein LptC [Chlamydiae bacterium]|nr:MAG: LPS export ABC transporter periplasmic protein LptC [Chlamydiota bacterium]